MEEKTEEFARKEKTYQILTQTKKYLEEAKTSFTNRYTEPLLRGFGKYYTGIVSKEASDYVLDANISMTVEELGKQRKPESLSAGRQDLIGICMRMALIEAMYEEEKPFLMLDDPFVNLDREKTENALQVLNEIGTDYQVLYFTCHDSRVAKDAVNS